MQSKLSKHIPYLTLLAIFAACITDCATTSAPEGYLPKPEQAPVKVRGGWVEIDVEGPDEVLEGELIAIHKDSLFYLYKSLNAVSKARVDEVEIFGFAAQTSRHIFWTIGGMLGSISHGWFRVITFPTWLVTGIITGIDYTRDLHLKYPDDSWDVLNKYSRFPAGMPEGFSPDSLDFNWGYSEEDMTI